MNNFIEVHDNALSHHACDHVIDCFEKYKDKTHSGSVGTGRVDTSIKDSTDLDLIIIKHLMLPSFFEELKKSLKFYVEKYISKNNFIDPSYFEKDKDIFWKLFSFFPHTMLAKKYKKNEQGYHTFHADWGLGKLPQLRQLICMYYLNDVEEGGETEFLNQDIKIKPKKGSLVIFPPYWTHLHKGHVPVSCDKYILNFWLLRGSSRGDDGFRLDVNN